MVGAARNKKMGKKRHQKDKLYLIPSEYAECWGGFKAGNKRLPFGFLPFNCCALSLRPFKNPVCVLLEKSTNEPMAEVVIFDKEAILAWLSQYKQNPITGKPLARKDLVPLEFHKNSEGEYICPVTFKTFNEHSFILANLKSHHVYLKESIDEVCRKNKYWHDLITGEIFDPSKDLVLVQNPRKLEHRTIKHFHFIANDIAYEAPVETSGQPLPKKSFVEEVIDEASQSAIVAHHEKLYATTNNQASTHFSTVYSTPGSTASLTSTAVVHKTKAEFRALTDEEVRADIYYKVKKKKLKS